jgi:hypothetical protein
MNGRLLWQSTVFVAVVLVFTLETVFSAGGKSSFPFQTEFPDTFPTIDQLKFDSLSQGEVKGEDFLGQAVLIVFFEPGCSKCTSKLPTFEKIRKTFESEGVTFIGMSSSGGGISSIAKSYGYEWVWAKNSTGLRPKLGAHKSFESFLFDRTGKIAYRFPIDERDWKLHLEIGLGSVLERALDLSDVSQAFVGSQVCGMCHPKELAQWENSPHANAYQTLVASSNINRVECHSCHVTGEQGRGSRPWQKTPKELQEIGCEECHGPGGPHRTKPFPQASLYSSKEESCKRCHDPALAGCSESWKEPKWDYATALKAVAHGAATPSTPETKPSNAKIEATTK